MEQRPKTAPTTQEICIDLPGETVQCWRSADKIKVILRKHRDLIFDVKLGNNKSYSVHAEHSDFYHAGEKKLIEARSRHSVSFKDGERLHLWIAREFKGALILKCDDHILMRFEPNKLDVSKYDNDPKTKPAPIIIALGDQMATPRQLSYADTKFLPPRQRPASAPIDEQCSTICVVEGSLKDAPKQVHALLASGGGKSGLADIDPNEIATRNWLLGQLSATGAYIGDNWEWLGQSIDGQTYQGFKLVKARVHQVRGKIRFYFSGYSKFNKVFGPGGFGPAHDRILSIFAGAGTTGSSLKAVTNGMLGSLKGNALVAFIFSSAAAMAEWKADRSKDGYDLMASLATSLLKSLVAAALTAAVVVLIVFAVMVLAGASLSVLMVGLVTVATGIGIGYGVDLLDKSLAKMATGNENSEGLSAVIAPHLRAAGKRVQENLEYLIRTFSRDYEEVTF